VAIRAAAPLKFDAGPSGAAQTAPGPPYERLLRSAAAAMFESALASQKRLDMKEPSLAPRPSANHDARISLFWFCFRRFGGLLVVSAPGAWVRGVAFLWLAATFGPSRKVHPPPMSVSARTAKHDSYYEGTGGSRVHTLYIYRKISAANK
jgi:hypothetical protein